MDDTNQSFDADIAAMIGNNYETPSAPAPSRDPGGRFTGNGRTDNDAELVEDGASEPTREADNAKKPKAEAEPPAKDAKDAKPDEAEDDEDYIELPPEEEGKEPTKLKLSEVIESHRKAQTLEQELGKLRAQPAMTPDVEQIVIQSQQARQTYIANAQQIMQLMQPRLPSQELLDEASPHYNPALYRQQLQQAEAMIQAKNQMKAEADRVSKEHADHEAELQRVRLARVAREVVEFAPEFKDPKSVQKFYADVESAYGFKAAELDAIGDARVVRVLKDALAGRQSKAAAETVKKAVSAKPKLVRSAARQAPANGKRANLSNALERLSRTGSLDDGARAIEALL